MRRDPVPVINTMERRSGNSKQTPSMAGLQDCVYLYGSPGGHNSASLLLNLVQRWHINIPDATFNTFDMNIINLGASSNLTGQV